MGILLTAVGQNFGAAAVGFVSPFTSVTSGLMGVFHSTRDSTFAKTNRSPVAGAGTPVLVGAPTLGAIGAGELVGSNVNHIDTKIPYSRELTLAVITKLSTGAGCPISAFTSGVYGVYTDFRTALQAYGVAGGAGISTSIPNPNTGAFELIVIRFSNTGGYLKIDRPATGAAASVAFTAGAAPAVTVQTMKLGGNPDVSITAPSTVAGGAVWNRAITDVEMATFYQEMKVFFTRFGKITLP